VLDGILGILHTGAPWRDLPERFGPWSSVYNTFRRWQSTGRIDAILEALQLHLNEEGLIDFDLWCLDGSNVRASKDAAGARKKTLRWIKLLATLVVVLAAKFTWSLMVMVYRWGSAFR
jgi:transposase